MAQDVTIAGAIYNDVPSIVIPKSSSGNAIFVDPTPTTATSSDVVTGKKFLSSNGILTTGSAVIPEPATANPLMDSTATVGTSAKYAREDHIHPSDTSRVPTSRTVNGKALSSDISLTASDVGALPSTTSIPVASDSNPVMDGTASAGTGTKYARADHVHPTDTSRQETLVSGTNIKTINNTSILGSGNISIDSPSPATSTPLMDGTGAVGTSSKYAKEDHVHPVDTSRASATDLSNLTNGFKSFTITLYSNAWNETQFGEFATQTVNNSNFIVSGYTYFISPVSTSYMEYVKSIVYANDITVDGQITFNCDNFCVPENNLTVNIARMVAS